MKYLSRDVARIIIGYAGESWDLLPWIGSSFRLWDSLSHNPRAIEMLMENQDHILIRYFVRNPASEHIVRNYLRAMEMKIPYAMTYLESRIQDYEIDIESLYSNPAFAEDILNAANAGKISINWGRFSLNPNPIAVNACIAREREVRRDEMRRGFVFPTDPYARLLYFKARNAIDRESFCGNPEAPIEMIREFLHDLGVLGLYRLSKNPSARPILLENLDKIDEKGIFENPAMMDVILDGRKINWEFLSKNPAAIDYLKANRDKVDWSTIGANIAIFQPRVDSGTLLSLFDKI
jgi:hypothetical protein